MEDSTSEEEVEDSKNQRVGEVIDKSYMLSAKKELGQVMSNELEDISNEDKNRREEEIFKQEVLEDIAKQRADLIEWQDIMETLVNKEEPKIEENACCMRNVLEREMQIKKEIQEIEKLANHPVAAPILDRAFMINRNQKNTSLLKNTQENKIDDTNHTGTDSPDDKILRLSGGQDNGGEEILDTGQTVEANTAIAEQRDVDESNKKK